MGAEASFQTPGDRGPQGPTHHAGQQTKRHFDQRRQAVDAVSHEGTGERANVKLAFGADVEESSPESESDGQPKPNVRGGAHQGLRECVVVYESAREEGAIGLDRVGARSDDGDGADEKAAEHRHQRNQDRGNDPAPPGREHQAAPAMSRPTRSRSASFASMTAATRPR